MSCLLDESPLSLREAAALLPDRPHLATMWRWWRKGVRGVRLETWVRGGRRFTSHEALERFLTASTAASPGASGPSPGALSRRRRQQIADAERRCAAAGI